MVGRESDGARRQLVGKSHGYHLAGAPTAQAQHQLDGGLGMDAGCRQGGAAFVQLHSAAEQALVLGRNAYARHINWFRGGGVVIQASYLANMLFLLASKEACHGSPCTVAKPLGGRRNGSTF